MRVSLSFFQFIHPILSGQVYAFPVYFNLIEIYVDIENYLQMSK